MTKHMKKFLDRVNVLKQWRAKFRRLEETTQIKLASLQRETQKCRAMLKRLNKLPMHVVFVCHNPSLWGKLSPVYKALRSDPDFAVSVVAVPYRHVAYGNDTLHDGGMAASLREEAIEPILGYDSLRGEWLDLQDLSPDYVFFQTPYDSQFPFRYTSEYVSAFARICYVPYYGILLYKGEVEQITHPPGFFKNVNLAFVAHAREKEDLSFKFPGILRRGQIFVAGSPMTDYTLYPMTPKATAWKRGHKTNLKRILWTPRWRTSERNCHFFDYKDYFLDLARKRDEIDFLFRPHPFCLSNFLKTGEFPQAKQDEMVEEYSRLPNARIDDSGDYQDTFLSSDILVSDMSSMMGEYFVTGKPIVYTHRVNCFNEFGAKLAQGFYWVHDRDELDEVLHMLLRGEDPLREKRAQLIKEMFFVPPTGAAEFIKKVLKESYCDLPAALQESVF